MPAESAYSPALRATCRVATSRTFQLSSLTFSVARVDFLTLISMAYPEDFLMPCSSSLGGFASEPWLFF
jgi:hypothetical protein